MTSRENGEDIRDPPKRMTRASSTQLPHFPQRKSRRMIAVRRRPRYLVDAAAADAQDLRLLDDRQIVPTVDHHFVLINPVASPFPARSIIALPQDTQKQMLREHALPEGPSCSLSKCSN